jgi:hypothetical protein
VRAKHEQDSGFDTDHRHCSNTRGWLTYRHHHTATHTHTHLHTHTHRSHCLLLSPVHPLFAPPVSTHTCRRTHHRCHSPWLHSCAACAAWQTSCAPWAQQQQNPAHDSSSRDRDRSRGQQQEAPQQQQGQQQGTAAAGHSRGQQHGQEGQPANQIGWAFEAQVGPGGSALWGDIFCNSDRVIIN